MSEPATAGETKLLDRMIKNGLPIGELVGFGVTEAGDGRAVVTIQTGPQHFNPMGTLHGGVLCDIADTAMGFAFASTLAAGESFTTVELKINYLRPVREARLRAEGRVVQRGRTVGYAECEVIDENGKLIAKSSSTCLVLRGEQAAGR
ncbi:MAG TPA: PaaI family thioesterase [Candidatus Acidoferrum sp.]|nr:PaaI family thioesterase [Candidatus Acidoferrum sp.]